ncbi:transposase [Calidifontibacter indicus]|uniref:transposase n=1 Tax=Calidifontibacter indicus TaxID=419650 RepID=UPI003D73746C
MWCAPLPMPGPAPDTAPAQKKLKHLRVDATSMQLSLTVAMTWWAQRSALPRTRRVGRCRGGCAGGRCCTCRSGIRTALPDARIAVDKWHLVALANLMVTQVRQRITRQLHGRRGTATDKVWASRQLLLTGYEHLTVKQKARFNAAQLPKAHHGPHRPHPRAETSSMKSAHAPLKCGEPLSRCVSGDAPRRDDCDPRTRRPHALRSSAGLRRPAERC